MECKGCGDKKYMFMSCDGSRLGGPTSLVAPCTGCCEDLSLSEIEVAGGFKLVNGKYGWSEHSYLQFEERFISFVDNEKPTKAQLAGVYALKMQTFGTSFCPKKINKYLIEKKSINYLNDVKVIAWGIIEGVSKFNKQNK